MAKVVIANRGLSVQSLEINKIGPKKGSKMAPEIGENTTEIALLQVGSNIPFVKAMTSLKSGLDKGFLGKPANCQIIWALLATL